MKITGIMACDPNGVVGVGYDLPWNFPEETAHFRRSVKGQIMIMGRKTYEATPAATLLRAICIVISRSKMTAKDTGYEFYCVHSINDCLEKLQEIPEGRKIFLIGGAEIVKLFAEKDLIDDFILTKMHKSYPGDIVLDLAPFANWHEEILSTNNDYTIYHLVK